MMSATYTQCVYAKIIYTSIKCNVQHKTLVAKNFGGSVPKIHLADKTFLYWVLDKVFEGFKTLAIDQVYVLF